MRQFPVLYDKGCKDFKDRNSLKRGGEIASAMVMEMVNVHLFNLFLI